MHAEPDLPAFADAMAARGRSCMYDGYPRAICPIILGHSEGAEKALTFQFERLGSKWPVRVTGVASDCSCLATPS